MNRYLLAALLAVVIAVVTWIGLNVGAHFWADHLLVDAIRADILQRQAQSGPAPVSTPPPPAAK